MPSKLEAWHRYHREQPLRAEGWALLACLLAGLTLVPVLIWIVGTRSLGPYTNGGVLHGSLPHWVVALGPYAALWCWRGLRALFFTR
jgi:hypothetical protein